jgi:hypothetical protein
MQELGLCLGMLVGTVLHALVFLYLMARADWERDALDAQQRAGVIVCLPIDDPEDIFHCQHSPLEEELPDADDVASDVADGTGESAGQDGDQELELVTVGDANPSPSQSPSLPPNDADRLKDAEDEEEVVERQRLLP